MPTVLYADRVSAVSFPDCFDRQIQVCSIWLREGVNAPYTAYSNILSEFSESVSLPVNHMNEGKSILLSVEGGAPFEQDTDRLYSMNRDGITSVMLTWNNDNTLAGGAAGDGGLTAKGVRAIDVMNRLGMALDVSHLNDRSLFAAAERADFVLASHSNCRSICEHKRNLPDDALKLIRDKGGLVGINFYPVFLGGKDVFESIYEHISHMLTLGLENCIAIGSDLDGADMDPKLSKTENIPSLYEFLCRRMGGSDIIDKIFFTNAYKFYEKLFDKRGNM